VIIRERAYQTKYYAKLRCAPLCFQTLKKVDAWQSQIYKFVKPGVSSIKLLVVPDATGSSARVFIPGKFL
jgi:hypothetical protein